MICTPSPEGSKWTPAVSTQSCEVKRPSPFDALARPVSRLVSPSFGIWSPDDWRHGRGTRHIAQGTCTRRRTDAKSPTDSLAHSQTRALTRTHTRARVHKTQRWKLIDGHADMPTHAHTWAHARAHIHTYSLNHSRTPARTPVQGHTKHTLTRVHTHEHVHTDARARTHTHTDAHAYAHTLTLFYGGMSPYVLLQ